MSKLIDNLGWWLPKQVAKPIGTTKQLAPKALGWTILLLFLVLWEYRMEFLYNGNGELNPNETQDNHLTRLGRPNIKLLPTSLDIGNEIESTEKVSNPAAEARPNILLVGISYSDATIGDAAREFLVRAACQYGIRSHIFLAKRDSMHSMDRALAEMIPTDGEMSHPGCQEFASLVVSPGEMHLINMTRTYHGALRLRHDAPNNPWNRTNRIARIKRSREYQRQKVREMLQSSTEDWKANSVIAMLDLDLSAHPPLSDLIQTARDYVVLASIADPNGTKPYQTSTEPTHENFHAICADGLNIGKSKLSSIENVTRYYDMFATVLLPNTWLHKGRVAPLGSIEGEDKKLAEMNPAQVLRCFVKKGMRRNETDADTDGNIVARVGIKFEPVPVRSCFNGLTLYRADVWLRPECRYDMYDKGVAYLSRKSQHACEHIIFHECLRRTMSAVNYNDGFSIAVKPDLATLWHGNNDHAENYNVTRVLPQDWLSSIVSSLPTSS